MNSLEISLCETPAQRRRFERVAETLHRGHPSFVPPFPGSIAKILAPESVFNRRHGKIRAFLATRGGRAVGRIAAIVNTSHNAHHQDRAGFFGFFECENDPATAKRLFDHAAEELRKEGLESMRGPYSPSINDECGLLVEGFDRRTTISLTWNPPYYERLVFGHGFQERVLNHAFLLPLSRLEPPPRLKPLAERFAKRSRVRLRPIDFSRMDRDLDMIREVYNATLKRNWGFVPLAMEDLNAAAGEMRAIAYPELIMIAEKDGENAGVALSLPDINIHLAAVRKTPWVLRPLHFLFLLKTRRLRRIRQIVYGVAPRFQNTGLHPWLTYEHFVEAQRWADEATLGWIESTNEEVIRLSQLIGGEPSHLWKIYELPLAPVAPSAS